MAEKDTDRILDLILNQLEKLNDNQEKLAEKLAEGLQNANSEISKISGLKTVIADFKEWKEARDKIVNLDDLGKMKEFYTSNKEISRDLKEEFRNIYDDMKELKEKAADYDKFKTKTMTIIAVISFLFTIGITILGWKMH